MPSRHVGQQHLRRDKDLSAGLRLHRRNRIVGFEDQHRRGIEMARNRLQVAISLDRPVLILTNQPTVGGRKRVINGPGRGGARALRRAKVIIVLRFILRFLLSLIKRRRLNGGRVSALPDVTE